MHKRAETEQLVCISIKKVKNLVQADEKLVSLSAENDLGSTEEVRDCTGSGEDENGGQTFELFLIFFFFPKKVPLAFHFQPLHSGFSLLESSEQ